MQSSFTFLLPFLDGEPKAQRYWELGASCNIPLSKRNFAAVIMASNNRFLWCIWIQSCNNVGDYYEHRKIISSYGADMPSVSIWIQMLLHFSHSCKMHSSSRISHFIHRICPTRKISMECSITSKHDVEVRSSKEKTLV